MDRKAKSHVWVYEAHYQNAETEVTLYTSEAKAKAAFDFELSKGLYVFSEGNENPAFNYNAQPGECSRISYYREGVY